MRSFAVAAVGASLLSTIMISGNVSAHGWTDYPKARQTICADDGGYWGAPDGSGIPNEACRAAYLQSGTYPFVQKNEFSSNVTDYWNMDSVKAVVKDGLLCSGGATSKSGMDIPSSHWQKTKMQPGKFKLRFRATAPHNPSYWQIYLSKPSYNSANQQLHWNDLDLIAEYGDLPVVSGNYEMDVTLPEGITGDAVLYVRWQRDDRAGEGFYNCSDIAFSDETTPPGPEPEPGPDLVTIGNYVTTAHTGAEADDIVRFRMFSSDGKDVIDEQITLTDANASFNVWSEQLAMKVNDQHSDKAFIGIWHDAMSHLMYDRNDVYANRVWALDNGYTYSTSIIKSDDPQPPVCTPKDPAAESLPRWDSSKTYVAGDRVNYMDLVWEAKWWISGAKPDSHDAWKLISNALLGWQSGKAYNRGEQVIFDGRVYEAKQWVKSSPVVSPDLWIDKGEYSCELK